MATARDRLRRAKPLLGTFVEIAAAHAAPDLMEAAVEDAFDAIARVHRCMSFHDPASDVSRLNQHAAAGAVTVDPWTFQVLEAAVELHRRSAGIFDIGVAPALQEAGLLPGPTCPRPPGPPAIRADEPIELLPGPLPPEVIVSHGAVLGLVLVHGQAVPVVRFTLLSPPAGGNAKLVALSV